MNKKIVIAAVVVAAGIGAGALWKLQPWRPPADENAVFASGTVDATEVVVSFRVPGTLRKRPVDEGSVVKTAGISDAFKANCGPSFVFEGPCVIFESQDDACAGILAGKVKAGDVVIIRNEGPRGGPGMQEMLSPTSYIVGMGLGDKCALITDGRFSGGTAGAGRLVPTGGSFGGAASSCQCAPRPCMAKVRRSPHDAVHGCRHRCARRPLAPS